MIKRFFSDIKKYYRFSLRSAKAALEAEVNGSYLNWLWWILNPICFMLIYAFIFGVVFNAKEEYFPLFIYIGLTIWDFFNHTVMKSIRSIRANRDIVRKIYIPKFVLIISDMMVNAFKMLISFGVIAVMMALYGIRISWSILYMIPVLCVLFIFTFGISCIVMHIGVFVQDMYNAINIVLRLLLYFTGIFYDVRKRIPKPFGALLVRFNPLAGWIVMARKALLNGTVAHIGTLLFWFIVSVLIAFLGVRLIYKNENTYAKVS